MKKTGASPAVVDEIAQCIASNQLIHALSAAKLALGPQEFNRTVDRELDDTGRDIPETALAIAALKPKLNAVLTTNVDRLLERAFQAEWRVVDRPTGDLAQDSRYILKLHGTLRASALARKLAQELAPQYPDAQLNVELRGLSSQPATTAEAMAKVIHAFDPEAKLPESEADLAPRYYSILHGKRVLLLLDDARSTAQIDPLVPLPGSLVLITSRERFMLPGLELWDLNVMKAEDAASLIRQIAPRLDQAAAVELARLCGYLPFAVRAAAGSIAEHRDHKVAEYINQLRRPGERGKLVSIVLSASLDLLEPAQRELWIRLGIFPGDFSAETAAFVGQIEADLARELLSEMLRRNLLEWDGTTERYRLHDLARDYAYLRQDASDRFLSSFLHASYSMRISTQANNLYLEGGDCSKQGLDFFDTEWENIKAAQEWAMSQLHADPRAAVVCSDIPCLRECALSCDSHLASRFAGFLRP